MSYRLIRCGNDGFAVGADTKMQTIAIVNEKGGSAKTTTAVNLSAALGELQHKVLLVDLDGQAASSRWLGVEDDSSFADALWKGDGLHPIMDIIPGVSLAPGSGKLDSVAHDLRPTQGGQLRKLLSKIEGFEYAIIDCPPSLGNRLIGNAMLAASQAIVPVETSILALDGLKILLTTLQDIRDGFDHEIALAGVLACRYDARTKLSRFILTELNRALPGRVFRTVIRENVRVRECPASGQSILTYAPDCHAAEDYRSLARELVDGQSEMSQTDVLPDQSVEGELSEDERQAVGDLRDQVESMLHEFAPRHAVKSLDSPKPPEPESPAPSEPESTTPTESLAPSESQVPPESSAQPAPFQQADQIAPPRSEVLNIDEQPEEALPLQAEPALVAEAAGENQQIPETGLPLTLNPMKPASKSLYDPIPGGSAPDQAPQSPMGQPSATIPISQDQNRGTPMQMEAPIGGQSTIGGPPIQPGQNAPGQGPQSDLKQVADFNLGQEASPPAGMGSPQDAPSVEQPPAFARQPEPETPPVRQIGPVEGESSPAPDGGTNVFAQGDQAITPTEPENKPVAPIQPEQETAPEGEKPEEEETTGGDNDYPALRAMLQEMAQED